mgnify:CR=1 FL=1
MAGEIQQRQVGNQVYLPDDGDILTEEELRAQEAHEDITPEPPAEEPPPEPSLKVKKPDRSIENYEGELKRRREKEERLEADLKARDDALASLREENLRFKARQDIEREAQEKIAKAKSAAERPDPETDPYGARLWDIEENLRRQKEITQRMEQREQASAQQGQVEAAIREVTTFLDGDVGKFKEEHEDIDYDAASNHVYQKYMEFWQATGLNPQEAQAVVANTFLAVGKSAQVRGKSAANAIYSLAKMTGWAGETPASLANPVKPGESAQAKIVKIAKAQKLQGLGGKTPSERTISENLASLSEEELATLSDDDYIRYKQDPVLGPLLMKRLEELG